MNVPSLAPPDGSLEGVIVAQTRIAHVDGRVGKALVRGYLLQELAAHLPYESVAFLVLTGELPSELERAEFARWLQSSAALSAQDIATAKLLAQGRPSADALAAAMVLVEDDSTRACKNPIETAARIMGRVVSVCAVVAGFEVPDCALSYAHRALCALGAKRDDPAAIRALEVLLSLEAEHGLSASTFACRIAASSGANAGPALAAATATLSGERHGGATAQARLMLEAAQKHGNASEFVREKWLTKSRLPGFGHRVYKVADPRVPPLRQAMHAMGDTPLLTVTEAIAQAAEPLFAPKGIYPNIDLYGAALLTTLSVDPAYYVAAFTVGIACGWLAHYQEVRAAGRLVRPDSTYTGPAERALSART
jgi:citrate synthase